MHVPEQSPIDPAYGDAAARRESADARSQALEPRSLQARKRCGDLEDADPTGVANSQIIPSDAPGG